MARCIQSLKGLTQFDHLDEAGKSARTDALRGFIKDFAYLTALSNGDVDAEMHPVDSAVGDAYVNRVLEGLMGVKNDTGDPENLWQKVVDSTPEERAMVVMAIDKHTQQIYRTMQNPDKVLLESMSSCRMKSIVSNIAAQEKASGAIHGIVNRFFKMVGVQQAVYGNKINIVQHWDPSRRAFMLINEINTYTETKGKKFVYDVAKIISDLSKVKVLTDNGLDALKISNAMQYFNGVDDIDNVEKHSPLFMKFLQEMGHVDDVDKTTADSMYKNMASGVKRWWYVNYGNSEGVYNIDRKTGQLSGKIGGVTEYVHDLKQKYAELLKLYSEAHPDREHWDANILDFENMLNNHHYRNHYIPLSMDDSMLNPTELTSKNKFFFPDWFGKQDDSAAPDGKIDFLENVEANILSTNMIFNKFANHTTAKYLERKLKDEIKSDDNWFRGSGRVQVRASVESLIHDLNALVNYQSTNQSNGAKVVKTAGNYLSTFLASYLMFPGSALTNYTGGFVSLRLRLGNDISGAEYHKAMADSNSEYHKLAVQVSEYADKYLISSGLTEEFISHSNDPKHRTVVDQAQLIANKTGDYLSDGLFGKFFSTWKDYLTLGGSEKVLRSTIKNYLYNQALASYKLQEYGNGKLGIENKDPDDISLSKALKDNLEDSWYEVTNALGLFSGVNKSYYLHTLNDTATDVPHAMVGTALKVWNTFRQVAVTGIDNMIKSGIDLGYDVKREGFGALKGSKGTAFGAMLLSLVAMALAFEKDEDSITLTPLMSITPLDGPIAMARLLKIQAAGMLGANVSDENYDMAKKDAVQYLVGALGGRYVADKASREMTNALAEGNNPITATYNTIVNGELGGGAAELYKARSNLRESFGSLTASDPIFFMERLVELGFIRSQDKNAERSFQVATAQKFMASVLGISIYANPHIEKKRWNQYDKDASTYRLKMYNRSIGGRRSKALYSKDVTAKMEHTLEKYGTAGKPRID